MRWTLSRFYAIINLTNTSQKGGGSLSDRSIVFIDLEVDPETNTVDDYGALSESGDTLHTHSAQMFQAFAANFAFLCGHNILRHDLQYITLPDGAQAIDTLMLSPLLFPNRPYHALLKDDKLQSDELNNPVNDAKKAQTLFLDELAAFHALPSDMQEIYAGLLQGDPAFSGFFQYAEHPDAAEPEPLIRTVFQDQICDNADLTTLIRNYPIELAYCLALITATDRYSVIPHWVHVNYPNVDYVMRILRGTPCGGCSYCRNALDPKRALKHYFGYDDFRTYNGEPLQEKAVHAAIRNESLLAVFPTGGGKSLTFQIPALMAGESSHALTVVISPLQSLMKDQVDNLEGRGIAEAVTINGLLSPIERQNAIERVENGSATLLYISPESLRSRTIERLFLSRTIARFVIDEAHCFSAWGQDFRVDYLYIGEFLRELQEKKGSQNAIPVSCFTATAKQKVISDIKDYFRQKLGLDLQLYATDAARTNLRYEVLYQETDEQKYEALRRLIEAKDCPTIVYVSRTKRTRELADKLTKDGFSARPFNGKMDSSEKQANQEAFIHDEVQIIVATSAFGMGVDKANVKLVVHYDISDSLENYVQEAGRAGRDQSLQAECYVLYHDADLDKHFIMLNQTKLSISEIQQVWRAIKNLTRTRPQVCCSPLEIAREAGWDDSGSEMETRITTAIQALENAGYVKRGKNVPRVYSTSIQVKSMIEARAVLEASARFTDAEREQAARIMKSLMHAKSYAGAGHDDAESRVDYLADILGMEKRDVISLVQALREEGLLADAKDLSAYIQRSDTVNKSLLILKRFSALEEYLLQILPETGNSISLKLLNEKAQAAHIPGTSVKAIRTLFFYWHIRGYVQQKYDAYTQQALLDPKFSYEEIRQKRQSCRDVSDFIVEYLYAKSRFSDPEREMSLTLFSVMELMAAYNQSALVPVDADLVEDALLFLAKIGAMKLEGGFLVLYSGMELRRLILDNKIRYKVEDYKQLNEYYQQKIQQIHIVGEFANMMVKDYQKALQFVSDYFQMDYRKFLKTYFDGDRADEITRNITPAKYKELVEELSPTQKEIIADSTSRYIVVAAGPGSGKTKVLVHKLASLLILEDVKHEQLLMVTFSRAAAIEFKLRLKKLIGNAAAFMQIKTFHSYCFDLLGKPGSLQGSENVVHDAVELIRAGEVESSRIAKQVLVIDEAQDMDANEFALIEALMERNEDMRVIAVGDDDQNIFAFRGSDSGYMRKLIEQYGAAQYDLLENYRSTPEIVDAANRFAKTITERMKSQPIVPVREAQGEVLYIRHSCPQMEQAVVEDLLQTHDTGNACILTATNQTALNVLSLLRRRKIPARLIQSMDGFDLYNIAEIRFFLKKLAEYSEDAVIEEEAWNTALALVKERYEKSDAVPLVTEILDGFRTTHDRMYRSDLEMFLHESRMEDLCKTEQGVVTVSTIHKAKGREFESVYMLLDGNYEANDEERRKLYVGMTRAKDLLHIHGCGAVMDAFCADAADIRQDDTAYAAPEELLVQLGHRDVFLDFGINQKDLLFKVNSGQLLKVYGKQLCLEVNGKRIAVVQFSRSFQEKLGALRAKGYVPAYAKVRFIVAWRKQGTEEEIPVLLPDLYLRAEQKGEK
ncbi:MAG: RecQ family ATP-dependent DNA helicase [Oscillospiraceae bacterium]|nr:RecQ family ATP-dependent DNA helicase [Oscillospiraceae bacterium]